MFTLVKVLIGRAVVSLDRPFDYWTDDATVMKGKRVIVPFGASKETTGFVLEDPQIIQADRDVYEKEKGIHLSKIVRVVDQDPILTDALLKLAFQVSAYYKSDLIRVLASFLPPSMKPKDSALRKPQKKTAEVAFAIPRDPTIILSRNEKNLYDKILLHSEGLRTVSISAKASLAKLVEKKAVEIHEIPVYRLPELEAKARPDFDLTDDQQKAYDSLVTSEKTTTVLQGVTGSGKTEIYIRLAQKALKEGKGVLILVPEIALTDAMASIFASYFSDSLSLLNSSISDARKYDEYLRLANGETKIVLGTRSAVFAPVQNLSLIIIDEEHASSYKQDSDPFYDAIKVAQMRCENEGAKLILGSATPRLIDKVRAEKNIYGFVPLLTRFAANQDKERILVNMNDSANLDPHCSSLISIPLFNEIRKTIEAHEQAMVLINRRGYSPIYLCRKCHHTVVCPNCNIPLSYHKRDDTLRCHHCGYEISALQEVCSCGSHDFLSIGYGTERATEDLKAAFPAAKILRLDSDVSSKEVRHEVLDDFSLGSADVLVGTELIAKGHDFRKVTLAAILDADSSLRFTTYLANEETFDLISQFVGRAGRADKKGRVLIQTYVPDNPIIQKASVQDYEDFYKTELQERFKYQYPPYTLLTSLTIKGVDQKRVDLVSESVKSYLLEAIGSKRFNIYGPTPSYIPHMAGRYYRNILLKYKSWEEASPILDGLKMIRLGNKDVEILINVDPGATD